MLRKITLFSICLLAVMGSAYAQDQNFTQFYAAPLTLNPSLTGALPGKYRFTAVYRDQGKSELSTPYSTVAGSIDLRFGVGSKRKRGKDAAGVGVVFYNDKSSSVNFFTNYIAVSGAYHKALTKQEDQFLSLGFQAGIAQRNVNYDNFSFDDQFNGTNGYTDPTSEFLPENNFSYNDMAVGLHYSYAPERRMGVFAGLALHHFLEPEISFYASQTTEELQGSDKLLMRYTGHLGLLIPTGGPVEISPRAIAYLQGEHLSFTWGSNVRFLLGESKGSALHLGLWGRTARNESGLYSFDSAVGLVGFEYNSFTLGFSYDAKIRSITTGGRNLGAFEISLSYLGDYDDGSVLCPKF